MKRRDGSMIKGSRKFNRNLIRLTIRSKKTRQNVRTLLSQAIGKYRNTPTYLALLLGSFALIGATLLATSHEVTSEAIKQRLKEDLMSSLTMVIPNELFDNDLVKDSYSLDLKARGKRIIYPAYQQGQLSALAFQVTGRGYGGAILILMGLDRQGRLLGVRVLQHAETPGLGDKIEANRDNWIRGFDGLSLGNPPLKKWAVKKDDGQFDQFSGATITPRAVVLAVRKGLEFFEKHKAQLVNNPQGAGS